MDQPTDHQKSFCTDRPGIAKRTGKNHSADFTSKLIAHASMSADHAPPNTCRPKNASQPALPSFHDHALSRWADRQLAHRNTATENNTHPAALPPKSKAGMTARQAHPSEASSTVLLIGSAS